MRSDVLIVGAGSAGCVLAERLSADADCHVTLVEAGTEAAPTRGWVLPIAPDSPVVAHYRTMLTDHPAAPADIVRGRLIGGSGAVNGGYFCWAAPADFRGWALPGWGWDDVAEHYRAIESDADFGAAGHGCTGLIPVRRTRNFSVASQRFIDGVAGRAPWLEDLNGPVGGQPGLGAVPLNIDGAGERRGPGDAFLVPALPRPNLAVLTGTTVHRIRFSGHRAVGVSGVGPDGALDLTADRIVLCAGAIESAHLLLRSGVGPASELAAADVPVVVDLPVGQWCADHPEWLVQVDWASTVHRPPVEVSLTTEQLEIRPYTTGFGAMTALAAESDPVHIGVSLMYPRSRGRLRLVSAAPDVPLQIEHHYDDEHDVAALRDGLGLVREVFGDAIRSDEPLWSTAQHLAVTAPMGRDDDERAVLDARCAVRGIDGLSVVDGASLPQLTGRGPHATIVMLAHRAAEFLSG